MQYLILDRIRYFQYLYEYIQITHIMDQNINDRFVKSAVKDNIKDDSRNQQFQILAASLEIHEMKQQLKYQQQQSGGKCTDNDKKQRQREGQGERQGQVERQRQRQRLRLRKYDYLNKYKQHEILKQTYQRNAQHISKNEHQQQNQQQQVKNKRLRIDQRNQNDRRDRSKKQRKYINDSLQSNQDILSRSYNQPKPNSNPISKDRSSSSSMNRKSLSKGPSAHYLLLQAYQHNTFRNQEYADPCFGIGGQRGRERGERGEIRERGERGERGGSPLRERVVEPVIPVSRSLQANSGQKQITKVLARIPNLSNGLSAEISYQNQILRGQKNQYKALVAKLQIQLKASRDQLLLVQQNSIKQRSSYQKLVNELKEENKILRGWRDKYQTLNRQTLQKLTKTTNIQMSFGQEDKQNRLTQNKVTMKNIRKNIRFDSKSRSKSKNKCKCEDDDTAKIQEYYKLIQFVQKIQILLCGRSSLNSFNLNRQIQQLSSQISNILSKNKKYEDFIYNIEQMYRKIQKIKQTKQNAQSSSNIRQLWKWLKIIGSNYSYIQQVKPLLATKVGLKQNDKKDFRQILELIVMKI